MTVSIIVPVYNSEKYLADCIESIMMQRHIDFELLLIDNGSTDRSLGICNDYIKRDNRIRLLKEEKRSPGAARNKGLQAMKGECFTFVDSDDYVSVDYISKMLSCMERLEVDLVECGAVLMTGSRDILRNVSHDEFVIADQKTLSTSVWGKLYKKAVFGDIRFKDDRVGEDLSYTRKVKKKGAKCAMCEYCLYGFRAYDDSITRLKPDRNFFKAIKKCSRDELALRSEELLAALEYRHEEAVYIKELKKLKKLERDRDLNTEKLDQIIRENRKSLFVYHILRIHAAVNSAGAAVKIRNGYKYVLD